MARSPHFSQKVKSEQNLYEDIIIESMKIYGQDVYYLPRTIVNENTILGEDVAKAAAAIIPRGLVANVVTREVRATD